MGLRTSELLSKSGDEQQEVATGSPVHSSSALFQVICSKWIHFQLFLILIFFWFTGVFGPAPDIWISHMSSTSTQPTMSDHSNSQGFDVENWSLLISSFAAQQVCCQVVPHNLLMCRVCVTSCAVSDMCCICFGVKPVQVGLTSSGFQAWGQYQYLPKFVPYIASTC